jgi:putative endonuclease
MNAHSAPDEYAARHEGRERQGAREERHGAPSRAGERGTRTRGAPRPPDGPDGLGAGAPGTPREADDGGRGPSPSPSPLGGRAGTGQRTGPATGARTAPTTGVGTVPAPGTRTAPGHADMRTVPGAGTRAVRDGCAGPAAPGRQKARGALGRYGESLAARRLAGDGMTVLARNWRCGRTGEIDIVARDGDVLVVCEVKTRRADAFQHPMAALGRAKAERLRTLAACWIHAHGGAPPGGVRVDLVGVLLPRRGAPVVEHAKGVA